MEEFEEQRRIPRRRGPGAARVATLAAVVISAMAVVLKVAEV